MVKFNISEEMIHVTPFTVYMEYILLNYNNFLENKLKEENITTKEFLYMYDIFLFKNVSQKELADLMYVSEANITKIVKKLEQKGYVERRKDESNKSRNIVTLTKKGDLMVLQLVKLTTEWETKVLDWYDSDKFDEFKEILYKISENSVDVR